MSEEAALKETANSQQVTEPSTLPEAEEVDRASFASLKDKISLPTWTAITERPFHLKTMSPVQEAVLPLLPQLAEPFVEAGTGKRPARDLLVRAKTGTGKTLAFLVPAVEARLKAIEAAGNQGVQDAGLVQDKKLEVRVQRVYARTQIGTIIISPTRELATQIANEAMRLTQHHDGFEVRLFIGGASKVRQMRDFMKGRRDIVVGTPGRLRDLLENEPEFTKAASQANMLVLDEADTLLDMGFRDDLEAIINYMPKQPLRQTFMFSATVSTEIRQIARAALDKNHVFIDCVSDDAPPTHAHIPQYHTVLPNAGEQLPHLLRLLAHDQLTNEKSKIIMFLPTTKMTQLFATVIRQLGATCLPSGKQTKIFEIHSKRNQATRDNTSRDFRNDKSRASILISSDVSARGVDYPGVTRVIQVGVPTSSDQYIHRVGRTGRGMNTVGRADIVLLPWEVGFVTWQLTHIPLKPLTTNELKKQVTELAKTYDATAPLEVKEQRNVLDRRGYPMPQPIWPYSPAHEKFNESITSFVEKIDEEAVKEVMMSNLGYYIGRSGDLRVQRNVVVEGVKDWTVKTMGLPAPPYVSPAFLAKLGLAGGDEGRNNRSRDSPSSFSRPGQRSWEGRGSQRSWEGRGSQRSDRRSDDRERGDSRGRFTNDRHDRRQQSSERDRHSFSDRDQRSFSDRDQRPQFSERDRRPQFSDRRQQPYERERRPRSFGVAE
ncbi:hypothetical protein POSPLADRAFT_1168986 [Postia placenta MAD-698-R-SB12]|uniref:ATP-dependent RNA helicase n=1 Tax=Postia placenta MAD-698-R-SB12 TaxID=670580 RepID=A0A1X6N4G8_9APHY|nr:hypothetical protein POSPLADRAFT_1168986 [Postia placenta MAD-698-R-SB12]OSX63508.1 hypothetical protein POSPLADRAFT_1168986 [Postia placenta MAD-698-R-SB12]